MGLSHTYQNSNVSSEDVTCIELLDETSVVDQENLYCIKSSTVCTSQTSGIYTMASSQVTEIDEIDNSLETFRERSNSIQSNSSYSFHGDGSDPTDGHHQTFLSAQELSDLIVDQENNRQLQKSLNMKTLNTALKNLPPPPPYPRKSPPPYPKELLTNKKAPLVSARHAPPPPPPTPPPLPTQPSSTTTGHFVSQLRKSEMEQYQQQLNSDTDFVYFPAKEPSISKQEYIDAKKGSQQMLAAALASSYRRASNDFNTKYASTHNLLLDKSLSLVKNDQLANFEEGITRTKSDDNILNSLHDRNRLIRAPYISTKNVIDFRTLREKSKNLDLPLISALCNDRNLIKQTKAFIISKQPTVTTTSVRTTVTSSVKVNDSNTELKKLSNRHSKNKYSVNANMVQVQNGNLKIAGKKMTTGHHRNPADKLPEIPRAAPNTYVITDSRVRNNKQILRSSPVT